jgi:hypothetical protein
LTKLTPRLITKSVVVPLTNRYAILDSGTTGNFVTPEDAPHLTNPVEIDDGPIVLSASGNPMPSAKKGTLPLSPHLTVQAREAFQLDELKTGTLISLSKLCDDDCLAIFSKFDVKILKDDNVIITGRRMENGLWSIPLNSSSPHQANGILRTDTVKNELATYHHATLGGPVPSTLLRAI